MPTPAEALIERILRDVESRDFSRLPDMVAPGAVLHTPRFHRPITDRQQILCVLDTVPEALDDFRYRRWWAAGDEAIMEFGGTASGKEVIGLDIFTVDAEGRIIELTVYLRPTSAHEALGGIEDPLIMAKIKAGKYSGQ